ncbi:MAG: SusD/RagB family nutrient-binding outer membrane lipoprotein [Bacteroidales bacterium]|nr:SusD/RagB family nutrient-binding outer membrane lipoprotein [Bacteroidales bacterium]
MKKILYSVLSVILAGMSLASCSDKFMTDFNTDPSKAMSMDPNAQLTTAELLLNGDLGMVEIYRNYLYAFTQQLMGCWNTTNYGGRHTLADNETQRVWVTLYSQGIKNVVSGINNSEKGSNIESALRIWRVYLSSVITDIYGDCPYSEAGLGYIDGISNPKYDSQEDIYNDFFKELAEAGANLDRSRDIITGDLIYDGDIESWKKLANSLRMRFAMRISNVSPEKAQAEFEAALAADGGIFTSKSDDALVKHMSVAFSFGQESYSDYRGNSLSQLMFGNDPSNNPSFVCSTFYNMLTEKNDPRAYSIMRYYFDGFMSATSPDGRIDITDEVLEKGVKVYPRDPGAYAWEPWPSQFHESELIAAAASSHPGVSFELKYELEPKIATNFLRSDNPGVIITFAETRFLLAEAASKGWAVGGSVSEYYGAGVSAAIRFLADNYATRIITDGEIEAYINANPVVEGNAEQCRYAINSQAWILHFTNPNECWANQRRSGYPRLKSPAEYGFGQFLTGGSEIPVRLPYPVLESSYNKKNYDDALSRMGGTDSWNTHLWWDVD